MQPPLHVLTLTPFFPFAANPVYGTYVSDPITQFAKFGLRSTVIGVSPLHHKRRQPMPSAPVQWMRYPTFPGNAGLTTAGFFLYRRLVRFAQSLHQRDTVDVIHAHATLPCGHAAYLLAEKLNVPFVITVHGLDVFNACFESGTRAAGRRARLSTEVYRRAASVICISHGIGRLLTSGMPDRVAGCVIYNGTDPEIFFPEEATLPEGPRANATPTILIVGNLLHRKGHEIVFKAIAEIAPEFPDVQCSVIGEGPDLGRFVGLARSLRIADRVSFLGRRDRKSVAMAMRECTVFALPSSFEGLGCVYLEAMASGKPVIACEGQGIAEIIEHRQNGWLIPVDAVAAMVDALRQLLGSAGLRAQLGENARRTILSGLTLSDQARQLADLYRAVTKRNVKQ